MPRWPLAQPFRLLAHNGEINTIDGNRNWAEARTAQFQTEKLPNIKDIAPLVNRTGSDSSSLDNMLDVLLTGGVDMPRALRMLIPPAWQNLESIDPDQHVAARAALERAIDTQKMTDIDLRNAFVDVVYNVRLIPLVHEGEVLEILAVGTDVTERKRSEEKIRRAEQKYRFMAERMSDVIWLLDSDAQFTFMSPSVERVLGYTPEEFIGKSLEFAMVPESAARAARVLVEAVQDPSRRLHLTR